MAVERIAGSGSSARRKAAVVEEFREKAKQVSSVARVKLHFALKGLGFSRATKGQ